MPEISVIRIQVTADCTTLHIPDSFSSALHWQFRDICDNACAQKRYVVDFSETTYIDSAAMGMLLLLRKQAGGDSANLVIINCSPELITIFRTSSFDKLFQFR